MSGSEEEKNHYLGNYRGLVVSTSDSLQRGRIKVQIYGFFDSIDAEYLPWAVPALPISSGSGASSAYGQFSVPEVDSHVWCFFEGGDVNSPVYFAEAPDGTHGVPSDLKTNYPSRRGFKTKEGHKFFFDDSVKEINLEHSGGARFQITESLIQMIKGTALVKIEDAQITVFKGGGSIVISASGAISMTGTTIDLNP